MEATELRIGNLVRSIKSIIEVDSVCPEGINLTAFIEDGQARFKCIPNRELYPIVLNEEWLLKFGFVDNGYGGYEKSWKASLYSDTYVTYRVGRGMNDYGFSLWEHGFEIKNGIEYVHQLQNGWYFLTRGEELTYP